MISLFSFGLSVDAATCSNFVFNSNSSKFSLATPIAGTEDIYSHDTIRDTLPQLLNQQQTFVDSYGSFSNTYNFYQRFNYAVVQQTDVNYFRIYYQDYQQLKSLNCDNLVNKFYLYAVYTSMNANSGYAYVMWGYMYNFYVDFHIDTTTKEIIFDSMSSTYLETPAFKTTTSSSFGSTPGWSYYTWDFPFIDSYNNFSIPASVDDSYKADFFRGVGSYAIASYNSYPNDTKMISSTLTPIGDMITQFTGDEVTEDSGDGGDGEDSGNSVDLKPIEDKLDGISGILDSIQDQLEDFKNGVLDSDETAPTGPDSSSLDELEDLEDSLTGGLATEGLKVTIDDDANTTIWYFITEFITINDDVFNLYITMLTLGIVVLILKR